MVYNFEDFTEPDYISFAAFCDLEAFNTHKRRVRPVSVAEVDLVEGLPFQAGRPVWLNLPVFDFFNAAGDLIEPVAVKR